MRSLSSVLTALVTLVTLLALPRSLCAQDDPEAAARGHFAAGREAFDAGRYEDALREFRSAHDLSGHAELLYNVGSAAERLARDEEALDAYRAFVAASPDHPSRPEAERRITVLEARLRARAAEPPRVAPAPGSDAPEPRPTVRRGGWLFSWIALGATALAGGAAGLSWALANDAYSSLEQTCYAAGCSEPQIAASDVQARVDATTAMLVVTGVLAAATIVLFVLEAPSESQVDATALRIGPGQLELRGTF